jgi:hypothetical protein
MRELRTACGQETTRVIEMSETQEGQRVEEMSEAYKIEMRRTSRGLEKTLILMR